MITIVEVRNMNNELLTLTLDSSENGYEVQDFDGLDPVAANIVSSGFANQAGEQYQSTHREKRTMSLKLGYDPNYVDTTVANLRSNLYKWFMPQTSVKLKFFSDDKPAVEIDARIEDMDSPLFGVRDPKATIAMVALLPDFINPTPIVIPGFTVAGLTELDVPYSGSIEAGIVFRLSPLRSISQIIINHRPPDGSLRSLEFDYPMISGDVLEISTRSGNKYATLTRAGNPISVLYGISPTSSYIELSPGLNTIRVQAAGDPVPYTITYLEKYGGL